MTRSNAKGDSTSGSEFYSEDEREPQSIDEERRESSLFVVLDLSPRKSLSINFCRFSNDCYHNFNLCAPYLVEYDAVQQDRVEADLERTLNPPKTKTVQAIAVASGGFIVSSFRLCFVTEFKRTRL
jgi:hypothetical protein